MGRRFLVLTGAMAWLAVSTGTAVAPPVYPILILMSDATPIPIRTPDQRLRVFISSTLQELAPERATPRGRT